MNVIKNAMLLLGIDWTRDELIYEMNRVQAIIERRDVSAAERAIAQGQLQDYAELLAETEVLN